MSKFLKSFFKSGGKGNKDRASTKLKESTNLESLENVSANCDSSRDIIQIDNFGDDEHGKRLNELWQSFTINESKEGIMQEMVDCIVDRYSRREPKLKEEVGDQFQFSSTVNIGFRETMAGHPADFLTAFLKYLQTLIREDCGGIAAYFTRIDNTIDSESSAKGVILSERRNVLHCIIAASILLLWPNNERYLTTHNGSEFQCFLMSIANNYSLHLESLQTHYNHNLSLDHLDMFYFVLKVHLFTIHSFSNALSSAGLNFDDNLPEQPWSSAEIEVFFQVEENSLILENNHGPLVDLPSSSMNIASKTEFFLLFVREGCFVYTFGLLKNLLAIITELIIPLQSSENLDLSQSLQSFISLVLITMGEALSFLLKVIKHTPAAVPSPLSAHVELKEIIKNILLINCSKERYPQFLIVRLLLIALRINTLNDGLNSTNVLLLYPKDIASIMVWLHRQYDEITESKSQILLQENKISFIVNLEYLAEIGKVSSSHDLWPWKVEVTTTSTPALLTNDTTGASIHVLQKDTEDEVVTVLENLFHLGLWNALITEVLGVALATGARPQSTVFNKKVNAKRIRYLFQSFYEMFRDPSFHSLSTQSAFSSHCFLPVGQITFVQFISQVFKIAEPGDVFPILHEYEIFRLLLGDKFLMSCSQLPSHLEDYFDRVDKTTKDSSMTTLLTYTCLKSNPHFGQYVWFLLHDRIIDYFHGLVIFSLYFQNNSASSAAPPSQLGYEDIMLVLTQYALSVVKTGSASGSYIVYRIAKLLNSLYDVLCSLVSNGSKTTRDKFIIHLFETLECLLLTRVNLLSGTATINTPGNESITVAATNSLTELILHLLSPNISTNFDWIDVLLVDDKFINIDISAELQLRNPLPKRMTRSKSTKNLADRPLSEKPGFDGRDRSCRVRGTVYLLMLLLLEEHMYRSSLQIIQYILVGCAEMIAKLDQEERKVGDAIHRRRKQNLRSLGAEVVNLIFSYLSVSHKHPNASVSLAIVNHGLRSLLHLLRNGQLLHLRIHIQEFIRRENLLYEFLKAFARSLYGFDSRPKSLNVSTTKAEFTTGSGLTQSMQSQSSNSLKSSTNDVEIESPAQVEILRLGLAFLTGVVAGNDASKNELRLLLQSSKDKLAAGRARFATTLSEGKEKNSNNSNATTAQSIMAKQASKLTSLILCAEKSPAKDTIVVLLDLILEKPLAGQQFIAQEHFSEPLFFRDEDRPKIKNTSVLPDYFQLIASCSPEVQEFAVRSFINLIRGRGSLINQNVCSTSRPKVLDIALDIMESVPESTQSIVAELIELLGRHSVSVASLKHLFRKLQTDSGGRPLYAWKIIQALQGMFHKDPGPKQSFVLEGISSGLRLPIIYKWPSMKGFSFCCWIRIESPRSSSNNPVTPADSSPSQRTRNYFPYILCLRDKANVGLELFLSPSADDNKYKIMLRYLSETGETSTLTSDSPKLRLNEGQWYFLAIAISTNSFYSKGEALIKLNAFSHKAEFSFTKLPEMILEPTIGDTASHFHKEYVNNTLRGQLGAMYFFSEALTEKQFIDINALGPDYVYNFEPFSVDYKDLASGANKYDTFNPTPTTATNFSILESGILTGKILLAYNPVVLRGRYFLDNTPEKNEVKWRIPQGVEVSEDIKAETSSRYCHMHAMKLPGTYRSTTQDVRLAINSLGGIRAIIPLFAQIDQQKTEPAAPVINSSPSASSRSMTSTLSTTEIIDYDPNFFPAVLGLFATMVEENPENITIFSKCGGFTAIRSLLDKASSENFNLITFNQLIALYSRLGLELSLQESCLDNILCNFKLWRNSAVEVQLALFDWLIETFELNCQKFPYLFHTQKLLDSFYQHYDYTPANLNILNNSNTISSNSNPMTTIAVNANIQTRIGQQVDMTLSDPSSSPGDSTSNLLIANSSRTTMMIVNLISQSASRLMINDLRQIRLKILTLIKLGIMLKPSKEYEDLLSIVKYLSLASHPMEIEETLLLIVGLLNTAEGSKRVNILLGLLWGNIFSILEYLYVATSEDSVRKVILWTFSHLMLYIRLDKGQLVALSAEITQKTGIPANPNNNSNSVTKSTGGGSEDLTPAAPSAIPAANNPQMSTTGTTPGGSNNSSAKEGLASFQTILDFYPVMISESDLFNNAGVFSGLTTFLQLCLNSGDDMNGKYSPVFMFTILFSFVIGKLPLELKRLLTDHSSSKLSQEDSSNYYSFQLSAAEKQLFLSSLPELAYPNWFLTILTHCLTYRSVNDPTAVIILDDCFYLLRNVSICEQIFTYCTNWHELLAKALDKLFNHYLLLVSMSDTMGSSQQTSPLYVTRATAASKLLRIACCLCSVGIKIGKGSSSRFSKGTPSNAKSITAEKAMTPEFTSKSLNEYWAAMVREERRYGATVVKEFIQVVTVHVQDFSVKLYIITNLLMISIITMKELAQSFYSKEFHEVDLKNFTLVKMKNIWILGVTLMEFLEKFNFIESGDLIPSSTTVLNRESITSYSDTGSTSMDRSLGQWMQEYPRIFQEFPNWLKRFHEFLAIGVQRYFGLNEGVLYILKNYLDFFYSNLDLDNHFTNYRLGEFQMGSYELMIRSEPCFAEICPSIDYARSVYAEANNDFVLGNNLWLSLRLMMRFIMTCHELFHRARINTPTNAVTEKSLTTSYQVDNAQFLIALYLLMHQLLKKVMAKNARLHLFESMRLVSIATQSLLRSIEAKQTELLSIMLGEYLKLTTKEFNVLVSIYLERLSSVVKEETSSSKQNLDTRLGFLSKLLSGVMKGSQIEGFLRYQQSDSLYPSETSTTALTIPESNASILIGLLEKNGIQFLGEEPEKKQMIWKEVIAFMIDFGNYMEDEILMQRMMEFGLKDQLLAVEGMIINSGSSIKLLPVPSLPSSASSMLLKKSSSSGDLLYPLQTNTAMTITTTVNYDLIAFISVAESRRLAEILKQIDYNHRRSEKRWTRIFSQLANERGPWGYATESRRREVYWTLDTTENDMHLRMRLRRNPFGTRHGLATMKSEGKESFVEESTILGGMSNNNTNNDRNIYADLKKYKKIRTEQQQLLEEADDETVAATDPANLSDNEDEALEETTMSNNENNKFDTETISVVCEVITPATNSSGGKTIGKLDCTKTKVAFNRQYENKDFDFINKTGNNEFLWAVECFPSTTWSSNEVCGVYRRHYQLRYVAIEIFFTNRTSIFLNLIDKSVQKRVYRFFTTRMKVPNLNNIFSGRPLQAITRIDPQYNSTITQAWVNRKISNFDYLLLLNFIAGRTFNDLAQYPVFPWILSDYTSGKLDLKEPNSFRNFQLPIGAQVESQRQLMQEKYESCLELQDDGIFPYHTGSHYSTSAMVIWYLLRMEPFTSYHVWLQDGKFDRPDRLFYSIQHTYRGCISNTQDVKELIPEFFFNPEFLYNTNNYQMGHKQTSEEIGDVALPAWSRDPSEFIRLHREALESEYVSQNLHHWIDLVFGCRQRPPFLPNGSDKAVESCNVFVHLSYVDAVDLETMKTSDPALYSRTLRQIDCYGQTPIQLFRKEHPRRKCLEEMQDLTWPIASVVLGADTKPRGPSNQETSTSGKYNEDNLVDKPAKVFCYGEFTISNSPIVFISECLAVEKLVTIDTARVLGYHTFQRRQPDNVPPFALKLDRVALGQSTGQLTKPATKNTFFSAAPKEKMIGIPFAASVVLASSIIDRPATLDNEIENLLGTRNNKQRYHEEETRLRNMKRNEGGVLAFSTSTRFSRTPQKIGLPSTATIPEDESTPLKSDSMTPQTPSSRSMIYSSSYTPMSGNLSIIQPGEVSEINHFSMATTGTGATPLPVTGNNRNQRKERVDEHIGPHLFCFLTTTVIVSTIPSVTKTFQYIFSCGHWDNTFKITLADTGRLVQSLSYHREVVTCITTVSDFGKHWIIVGSKDCTITVWEFFPERESEPANVSPTLTLYGHDDAINCIAANAELDIIASGSDDGTIIIHTLREGVYLRSLTFGRLSGSTVKSPGSNTPASEATTPNPSNFSLQQLDKDNYRVHLLTISKEGHIIAYSHDGYMLATYTLNGRYLRMISVREKLHVICLSEDGKVILTGGERGLIILRWVHNLMIANNGARKGLDSIIDGSNESEFEPFPSAIRCMLLTSEEQHLIVGLESGEIRILAQDSEYLRRKLHRRLMEIGILSM